jgi:hypothetical protein
VLVISSNRVILDFTDEASVLIVLTSVFISETSVLILFMSDDCWDISFWIITYIRLTIVSIGLDAVYVIGIFW